MELTAGLVFNVALSAAAMLLVGALAWLMLRLGDEARYSDQAGIATLAALKWREFARLLAALFRARGFEMSEKDIRSRGSGGYDLLFTRGTARYLLLCKHGTSYRVDRADTDAFLMTMRTQGAEGGFIVALGQVDPDARQAVYARNLDLFEGGELWRELQRFIPRELADEARERALAMRTGLTRRASLLAVLTGMLTFIASSLLLPPDKTPGLRGTVVTAPAMGDSVAGTAAPAQPVAGMPAGLSAADPARVVQAPLLTQVQLSERRAAVIGGVRKVPGVVTADWSTNSTLLVTMQAMGEEQRNRTVAAICAQLAGLEELNWTRLQMIEFTSTRESTAPVRWHQCR